MTIRFAIFDMDDVLCAYDVGGRIRKLADFAGRTPEEVSRDIWESGFLHEADNGRWDADAFLKEFGDRLGAPIDKETWLAIRRTSMQPLPDTLALVRRLAGRMPVAVLTNNDALVAREIDALFPALRGLFGNRILVSATLGWAKPDPHCYLAACKWLAFNPTETFFTDDLQVNVEGARMAGLTGHRFRGAGALALALQKAGAL
ncbi:HAD family phosphatase [uncultured Alsobacter sp.]|uniref:HAD family hydrolase n=1 Tax=uncultured Alsobacter sp. TaxID=1748258 RepID=UPI0025EBCB87|nr:HAD family phosphatase [uncultured Alsobacter sp.]